MYHGGKIILRLLCNYSSKLIHRSYRSCLPDCLPHTHIVYILTSSGPAAMSTNGEGLKKMNISSKASSTGKFQGLGVGLQWQIARLFSGNRGRQGGVPLPLSPHPVLRSNDCDWRHQSAWTNPTTLTPLLLNTDSLDGWLCLQSPFPQLLQSEWSTECEWNTQAHWEKRGKLHDPGVSVLIQATLSLLSRTRKVIIYSCCKNESYRSPDLLQIFYLLVQGTQVYALMLEIKQLTVAWQALEQRLSKLNGLRFLA